MIRAAVLTVALACLAPAGAQRPVPTPLTIEVTRAFQLLGDRKIDEARKELTRISTEAAAAGDHSAAGEALRGLARIATQEQRIPEAKALLVRALEEADAARIEFYAGQTLNDLGFLAWSEGNGPETRKYLEQAAARFERAGAPVEYANALRNITFARGVTLEEKERLLERAVRVGRNAGNHVVEGLALHQWGDELFGAGEYAKAVEKITAAVALLDGDRPALARALTSLGRAKRAHGYPDQALEHYRRGLEIQVALGDLAGQSQSENAIATALNILERHAEALEHFERAMTLANESKQPRQIKFQRAQLGRGYLELKRFDDAAATMRAVLADGPDPAMAVYYQSYLAEALAGLKQWDAALAAADVSVTAARAPDRVDTFAEVLMTRARIRRDAGQLDLALADGREILDNLEQLRTKLVPDDFLKRGFSQRFGAAYNLTIGLLASSGRPAEAMVAAESARGRAFVDLLATKDITLKTGAPLNAALAAPAAADPATPSASGTLTFRGAAGAARSTPSALDPNLPSLVTVPSMTGADLTATAARLKSTLLAFWVDADAVHAWVVRGDGTVEGTRTAVSSKELERLVRDTWQSLDPSSRTRGLTTRGGTRLSVGSGRDSYRQLYDLLIGPLASRLPVTAGARITIVPHGPLFGLSFAALMDPRGRYFIERYTVHYAPSAAALQYAARNVADRSKKPHYLLIADPANAGAPGDRLPRLPGARSEAAAIRALLPAGAATIVSGTRADAPRITALAPANTVLHFATHGVVFDDRPLDSYLALANGTLTARDIYGLDLHADLIVLSACRSAAGRITGDGIIGLTRAFFYAGTPSIVATLSDVADVSAAYLVPRFYRSWQATEDKAGALRASQLSLLRALRAGQIKVQTAAGEFVVPEHPALWAPFVLIGQP